MKYRIVHTTSYSYSAPVSLCRNIVKLSPREDGRIVRESHRLTIRPTPETITTSDDFFGNHIQLFALEESHRALSIKSTSRVKVMPFDDDAKQIDEQWEHVRDRVKDRTDSGWLQAAPFRFSSPRVPIEPEFAAYAETSFRSGGGLLESLQSITQRINTDFTYDSTATHVDTPTQDAFANRHGVCQDFAHVQIACLRSIGIPARYMSGYLRTLPPQSGVRMIGADESHAWIAAYCGERLGWVEFDPTNNCRCSSNHITIAWGRDYGDVVPVRGVYLGGGKHVLNVSVEVEVIDNAE